MLGWSSQLTVFGFPQNLWHFGDRGLVALRHVHLERRIEGVGAAEIVRHGEGRVVGTEGRVGMAEHGAGPIRHPISVHVPDVLRDAAGGVRMR